MWGYYMGAATTVGIFLGVIAFTLGATPFITGFVATIATLAVYLFLEADDEI